MFQKLKTNKSRHGKPTHQDLYKIIDSNLEKHKKNDSKVIVLLKKLDNTEFKQENRINQTIME